MSDNKYNPTRVSKHTSQADINFANAAKAMLKEKFMPSPKTPHAALFHKYEQVATLMKEGQIDPILQAGGGFDKESLAATICTMWIQALDKFSKDELINLCASMSTEAMLDSIDKNPWAKPQDDKIS